MPTVYTLADLQKDVLSRLNEASDSPVGEFHAGDGSGVVISTPDTITKYLNDGAYDLSRRGYPIFGDATITFSANQRTARMQDFTVTPTGSSLWAVRQAGIGSANLPKIARSEAEINFPFYAPEGTASTPKYYYADGAGNIGLCPIPNQSTTVKVNGLVTPPALSASTDTAAWLEPDLYKLLVYYAAYQVATRNLEDPALKQRVPIWQQSYEVGVARLAANLAITDPRLYRSHFASVNNK